MNLTVTFTDSDVVVGIEVSSDMTVADLRAYTLSEAGFPADSSRMVFFRNRPLAENSTLQDAGLSNDDVVLLSTPDQNTASVNKSTGGPRATTGATGGVPSDFGAQIENARQQILYDPQLLVQLSNQSPELAGALHDPADFQRAYLRLRQQQQSYNAENDEIDRNFRLALEEMPEAFTTVTMLFANIEVNGTPVKAFVDSGAQTTIMSPACAERCQLSHLIDKRHRGMAYGVGQATILGRIHMAPIKIGKSFFACSMTVIEGTNIEFLLGLDMLKHHQAVIDLRYNVLRMGSEELPFLPESEVPKNMGAPPTDVGPKVVPPQRPDMPGGGNAGPSTATMQTPNPSVVNPSGNAAIPSNPPVSQNVPITPNTPFSQNNMAAQAQPPAEAPFSTESINSLMNLGFNKQEAIAALRKAGGNPEIAAAFLFGE